MENDDPAPHLMAFYPSHVKKMSSKPTGTQLVYGGLLPRRGGLLLDASTV